MQQPDSVHLASDSVTPESLPEAAHMPGPWEVVRMEARYAIYSDSYRIASVHDFNGRPINERHAKLMAAAPELLEALEWLVAILPDPELDNDELQRTWTKKARAAIAKAGGSA